LDASPVLAWGPGVHTVAALHALSHLSLILPSIAQIIANFPLEFMYGCLAADFFIGKGRKSRTGNLHNWEGGYRILKEAGDDREAAYAYGFLSHLSADVLAHNIVIPKMIRSNPNGIGMGHLYWEMKSDHLVGILYIRIARDLLRMDHKKCDQLLAMISGKAMRGLKAKKHLFAQSIKMSDYVLMTRGKLFSEREVTMKRFLNDLVSMVAFSCRVVLDFLKHPETSPCLNYDPVGRKSLRIAKRDVLFPRRLRSYHPSRVSEKSKWP
jgi:hypothetical protein